MALPSIKNSKKIEISPEITLEFLVFNSSSLGVRNEMYKYLLSNAKCLVQDLDDVVVGDINISRFKIINGQILY